MNQAITPYKLSTTSLSKEEKINIFISLFKGKTGVFAQSRTI